MIIDELQHRQQTIDIEGDGFGFMPTMVYQYLRQILVEIHPKESKIIHELLKFLRVNNYGNFSKESNLPVGATHSEYAFLRLNKKKRLFFFSYHLVSYSSHDKYE